MKFTRPNAKTIAKDLFKVDVFWLKEHGYFIGLRGGVLEWELSRVRIYVCTLIYATPFIRFEYVHTDECGKIEKFAYKVMLEKTKCNLGGERFWFKCPCGKRVSALYLKNKRFACRHCHKLSYSSKNENRRHRIFSSFYVIDIEDKMDEIQQKMTTPYYKDKPTRKMKRLMKLENKIVSRQKRLLDDEENSPI